MSLIPNHSDEPKPLTLFTIGHGNLSADDFLQLLQQHHITVLVDVRSAPYSRYVPHFNKRELEAFLKERGVDYRFAGEYLGGRPTHPELYKQSQLPDEDTERAKFLKLVDYEAVMQRDWYLKGIHRLLDIVREEAAKGGSVAIMCSESNPEECHRHHLITRSLIDPRVKVVDTQVQIKHLLKHGTAQTVDPAVFERSAPSAQQLSLWGE